MGYSQRLLIGIVVFISGYLYLNQVQDRQDFHHLLVLIHTKLGHSYCYECSQTIRVILSALFISSGLSLILDLSIVIAIISEFILISLKFASFYHESNYQDLQYFFIHTLFFFILWEQLQKCKAEQRLLMETELALAKQRFKNNMIGSESQESIKTSKSNEIQKNVRNEPAQKTKVKNKKK